MCYGAAIGSPAYVKDRMKAKVKKFKEDIDNVMDLLQAAWTLLSCSISSQLDYLLSLQYPSDILEVAAAVVSP